MAFQLARRTWSVVLMVPTWPESGFREVSPGYGARDWPGRARTATGELWMGLTWSAVRMGQGMLADAEEPEGRG
jgi:hypothetical protein